MNTIKKYFFGLFLVTGLLLLASTDVSAQRGGGHAGGGGGGAHFSGGGGARSGGFSGGGRSASFRGGSSIGSRPAASYSSRPASAGRAGYAARPGIGGRGGYAGRPGIGRGGYAGRPGYGYGHYGGYHYGYGGYWGRGWRGYYPFYPAFGFRLGILPLGYYSFYWGGYPYYYYDGIYYQPYGDDQYQVVEPPLDAAVTQLPSEAVPTVIDGQIYYEFHGTYYKQQISADNQLSYIVVGRDGVLDDGSNSNDNGAAAPQDNYNDVPQQAPVQNKEGDKVSQLPDGTRPIVINQQKYFVDPSGTYYQEQVDGNKVTYLVVGTESTPQQ